MAQSAPSTPTGTHDSTFNQTQWEAIQAAIDAKLPNFKTGLSTLKSQKPDTYTPGRRSDLNLWLFGVEQYLKFQEIPESLHVSYAATLLRGTAMSLWRYTSELANNGGQALPTTWPDFKSFLIGAFQPINPVKLARDKLSTLRQTTSVQAYFYQFQTLSMEIPGLSGEESTDRFIRGLKPHIRQEIELRGLTTFPDILTTAQRMDALTYKGLLSAPNNGYSNKRNGNSYIQPSYPQQSYQQPFHDESTPMEIDAMRNNQPNRNKTTDHLRLNRETGSSNNHLRSMLLNSLLPRPKLSDQQRDYLRRNNGCFYCRRLGHNRMNCPVKAQNRPQQLNNIQNDGPGNVQQRA